MPAETAADRDAFVADFGDEVTWTRDGNPQPPFLAIVDRPTVVVEHAPETAGTLARATTLSCPEASLPPGASEDDPVSVVGIAEVFACGNIRPDGTGWCVVDLKRV